MPMCDDEYERGLVCFGEARHRVVCESGEGGEGGRGAGDYSAGSLSTRFTTLFVLRMGRD